MQILNISLSIYCSFIIDLHITSSLTQNKLQLYAIQLKPIGSLLVVCSEEAQEAKGRESELFASLELTPDPVLELEFHPI